VRLFDTIVRSFLHSAVIATGQTHWQKYPLWDRRCCLSAFSVFFTQTPILAYQRMMETAKDAATPKKRSLLGSSDASDNHPEVYSTRVGLSKFFPCLGNLAGIGQQGQLGVALVFADTMARWMEPNTSVQFTVPSVQLAKLKSGKATTFTVLSPCHRLLLGALKFIPYSTWIYRPEMGMTKQGLWRHAAEQWPAARRTVAFRKRDCVRRWPLLPPAFVPVLLAQIQLHPWFVAQSPPPFIWGTSEASNCNSICKRQWTAGGWRNLYLPLINSAA